MSVIRFDVPASVKYLAAAIARNMNTSMIDVIEHFDNIYDRADEFLSYEDKRNLATLRYIESRITPLRTKIGLRDNAHDTEKIKSNLVLMQLYVTKYF